MSWEEIKEVPNGGVTIEAEGASIEVKNPVTADMLYDLTTKLKKERKLRMKTTSSDPVNSPSHYKVGGIETIDFIEAKNLGYNLGNVVKYVTRAHHKGALLEDLKKAQWYLNREVGKLEEK